MYKNINWKEERIEREFDNPQDFQSFAKTNAVWWLERLHSPFTSPILWLGDWANLQNYFDNLLDRKLWLSYNNDDYLEGNGQSDFINLDKYEQELEKIEYQKHHKDESLKSLKANLQKLKEYKKRFKEEWREDIVTQIDADIKKIEEEIHTLDK